MIHRRAFLTGLVAAPLVAHADNLMRLRGVVLPKARIYEINASAYGSRHITDRRIEWVPEELHQEIVNTIASTLGNGIGLTHYPDWGRKPEVFASETFQVGYGIEAVASQTLLNHAARLIPAPVTWGFKFIA